MSTAETYSLSPLQEGMLVRWLREPNAGIDLVQVVLAFEEVDLPAFQAAWVDVVKRHSAMRTAFRWQGVDSPVQFADASVEAPFHVEDWQPYDDAERQQRLSAFLTSDRHAGFDLASPPLFRLAVFVTGPRAFTFVWSLSHTLMDGRSAVLVLRDVFQILKGAESGVEPRLPETRPYRHFIEWRERQDPERAESWWREKLGDFSTPAFPDVAAPGEVREDFLDAIHSYSLSAEDTATLTSFVHANGIQLSTLVYAAWALLLSRYAHSNDVVFGTIRAGRLSALDGHASADRMVGLFINTVPVRARISDDMSVLEWLRSLRKDQMEVLEYEHTPLPVVQGLSAVPSGTPLFETLVVFENRYEPNVMSALEPRIKSARVLERPGLPVTLHAYAEKQLLLRLEHNERIGDAAAKRMLGHLAVILGELVTRHEMRLGDIGMLTADERHVVLEAWNDTDAAWPQEATLDKLFAAACARHPTSVAVQSGESSITYIELDQRANAIAWALRDRGIGADSLVAVCMDKSIDIVAVLLGVLKAGGAYVPIDPTYPDDRIAFMLEDSEAKIVIADSGQVDRVRSYGVEVLDPSQCAPQAAPDRQGAPPSVSRAENLCYVIYTSGSTGRPKGVLIEHRNVVRLLFNDRFQFDFGERDVWTVFHSFSFDFSVWEMYGALLYGGRLVIVPRAVAQDSAAFLALLSREQVTVLNQVPSAFFALMHEALAEPERRLALRYLIFGGEALQPSLLRDWKARYPATKIINMFGITETTVHVTFKEIGDAEIADGTSNIGRPIPTLRTYVLDERLQPVPLGVTGEICVGGAGVARGYLKRPELTAQRFVADPFGAGERMYRSGDLGRLHETGEIEYLGRGDAQVKIRGFRVELGEIDALLLQQPEVSAAVTLLREDTPGNQRLVSYILATDASGDVADLRERLRSALPAHMVPSHVIRLREWPITANGKFDRKALPAPEQEGGIGDSFVAPRTPVEELLAGIWSDVLRRDQVGAFDDFFELGGHSLLAARVVSRIRASLGVSLPLQDIFTAPRLSELAERIVRLQQGKSRATQPPIVAVSRDAELPLSYAQQRFWFLHQLAPSAVYNVPSAWAIDGPLNVAALRQALTLLVQSHESLRTRFVSHEGRPRQVVDAVGDVALNVVDVAGDESALQRVLLDQTTQPFDLERGPLIRATLVRSAPEQHVFILMLHHIITDAWSMGILWSELSRLYDACAASVTPELRAGALEYADFAAWQRQWLTDDVVNDQADYWRRQLRSVPAALELLPDRPRPVIQTDQGAKFPVVIPPDLYSQIRRVAKEQNVTVFMVLMAALQSLLHRYTAQDDIVVGIPSANRPGTEMESVVGCFLNTLAIRVQLASADTFVDVLKKVRESSLGAYAHQEVPFERLIELLNPPRDLSRSAFFQVMLAFNNAAATPQLAMRGVKTHALPLPDGGVARYDMTYFLDEGDEGIGGVVEYNTDLFDASTIERFVGHLMNVLREGSERPTMAVRDLTILSGAERRQLVEEWNETSAEFPRDLTAHQWIEQTAATHPGRVAVQDAAGSLTYAELDAAANRLATHLRAQGVSGGTLAAVCLERSRELLIGMLAVWKAGAAYVPLDPEYPRIRIAQIVEDAAPPVIITQESLVDRLPAFNGILVRVDTDRAAIAGQSSAALSAPITADDLAYVIFTSGSTGRPKGVQLEHRGLVNFLNSMRVRPGLTADDILLAVTTVSFDIAALELFLPLVVGARVVIAPRDAVIDGQALAALLDECRATVMQATPVTWRILLEVGWKNERQIRMLCGGEALPAPLAEALIANGGELWNMYGPTETTIWSAAERVDRGDTHGVVPIGGPVDNTTLYVLDAALNPVPIGVAGELLIGGSGVARGYLNRPELTAEKFVANPFGCVRDPRLYRTGDRVRYRPNGQIEFLGRIDHQVKVRGYRIELGEIEAALREHASVEEAVVVALDDPSGMKRLVGYVESATTVPSSEWTAFLGSRLPEYMIPGVVVTLAQLPRTANGKIDRASLPAPELSAERHESIGPRDGTEERVLAIWKQVLGERPIGVTDHFNDVGGHSLAAVQVFSRITKAFGREIPLATILKRDTVAEIAELLRAETLEEWQCLVPFETAGTGPLVFCVHGAMGNVNSYHDFARSLAGDFRVYGIQAVGNYGTQVPMESIEAMAEYYVEHVLRLQPRGPYIFFGQSTGGSVALEMARVLRARGLGDSLVGMYDTVGPSYEMTTRAKLGRFFIRRGGVPLWRIRWIIDVRDASPRTPGNLFRVMKSRARTVWRDWRELARRNELLRRFEHTNPPPGFELPPYLTRVWLARSRLAARYKPPVYPGRITLFRAQEQEKDVVFDATNGWKGYSAELDVREVPGNHVSALKPPLIEHLVRSFRECVATLMKSSAP